MIPILYEGTETSFTSNGIGRLSDCISCSVTQERNGIFELEFTYPISGVHYADIKEGRIVAVIHDDKKDVQPFDIYMRSAPINGVVTFYAHHISYRLGNIIVEPFSASSCAEAFSKFAGKSINNNPFTFWTDKTTTGSFIIDVPVGIKSILAGVEGSILDSFGRGDYEWDKFTVKLYQNKGQDNNITIRYGNNLTDLVQELDISNTYNAVVPYWYSDEVGLVMGGIVRSDVATNANLKPVPLDLSSNWDSAPTRDQLIARGYQYMMSNETWLPRENLDVDFIALWQTEEYKDVAPLQRLALCDYAHVVFEDLGVNAKMQIIRVEYDVLRERFSRMELGSAKTSLSQMLQQTTEDFVREITVTQSDLERALTAATDLINGDRGGYKVEITDADGHPQETLYMDAPNIEDAVNILRIGKSGIAFSNEGYNPQKFVSAWTIDGQFVADFITAGTLNANLLKAGIITDRNGYNYWNLETGELHLAAIDTLQREIDNHIETYYYNYAPTLDNLPASEWDTEAKKKQHEGDLFFWEDEGFSYRFMKLDDVWQWQRVSDTDAVAALEKAEAAQLQSARAESAANAAKSEADAAKKMINELSVGAVNILRGTNTVSVLTSSGAWDQTKWRSASGGNGTRTSINVVNATNANIVKGWSIKNTSNVTSDIAQDNVPIKEGKTYTFSCYVKGTGIAIIQYGAGNYASNKFTVTGVSDWQRITWTTTIKKNATGQKYTVSGKTNVYFGNRGTGTLQICGMQLEQGTVPTDWSPSPYDEDTAIAALRDSLTQQDIFNRLTKNGQTQGLFLKNNKVYINASYIGSGTMSANYVRTGLLTDKTGKNIWNLNEGIIKMEVTDLKIKTKKGLVSVTPEAFRVSATELSWTSTNSSMSKTGVITCKGATIDGSIRGGNLNSGSYIDMNNGHLNVYYKKTNLGFVGANSHVSNDNHRGIVFDLNEGGYYMAWASRKSSSEKTYTFRLVYSNKAFAGYKADRLNLGCDIDMHGQTLRNVRFENGGITSTWSGTYIKSMASDGTARSWSTFKLVFKNGLLTSASW